MSPLSIQSKTGASPVLKAKPTSAAAIAALGHTPPGTAAVPDTTRLGTIPAKEKASFPTPAPDTTRLGTIPAKEPAPDTTRLGTVVERNGSNPPDTTRLGTVPVKEAEKTPDTTRLAAGMLLPTGTKSQALNVKDAARVTMVSYKAGPVAGTPMVEVEQTPAETDQPPTTAFSPPTSLPFMILFALRQAGDALPPGTLPGAIPIPPHWLFIGANPKNVELGPHTLCLDHPVVSQAHCCVMEYQGHVYVCDLGSTNGTWRATAEGEFEQVHDQPVAVKPGEFIMMGEVALQVVTLQPPPSARPAVEPAKKNPITRALGTPRTT